MRTAILRQACLLLAVIFAMSPAEAAKRVALVIGINSYSNLSAERQLKKAVNDARSIRDALKDDLGFDVLYEENADWAKMNSLIKQVEARIESGDVVFIYFSGHGVSIGGENYLLPSDVPEPRQGEEARLTGNSFGAEAVGQRLRKRGAQAVFSVLDACRDNPFVDERGKAVGASGGLTTIDQARGVFTLFAAGLGQIALDRTSEDDPNPNSVFTRSLLPLLKTNGLTQVDLAKRVQQEVVKTAAAIGHDQMPVYNDGLFGFVTLKEGSEDSPVNGPETVPQTKITSIEAPPATPQTGSSDQTADMLGMKLSVITDAQRQRFDIDEGLLDGAVVTEVDPNGPAAEKRIEPGDVITEAGQETVGNPSDVAARVKHAEDIRKKSILLFVAKGGKQDQMNFIAVRIEEHLTANVPKTAPQTKIASIEPPAATPQTGSSVPTVSTLGMKLSVITDADRQHFNISEAQAGVVIVTEVDANGPAAAAHIAPGDVIADAEGKAVDSPSDLVARVKDAESAQKKAILLSVIKVGAYFESTDVSIELTAARVKKD